MKFPERIPNWLLIVPGVILAFMARITFFESQTPDYVEHLAAWFEHIKIRGGIHAFKDKFYDYTPSYLYFILLLTYIPVKALYSIKLLSVAFDFLAAWIVSKIIRLKYPDGFVGIISFFVILIHPTVVLNSSYWGQCDVIYGSFYLVAIYCMLQNKNIL